MDSKTRALIVEDEAFLREAIADVLSQDFNIVEVAADGKSALKKLEEFKPDLVISDVNMPNLDGMEMLKRLRASGDDVPVIFVTARGDKQTVLNALRLGAGDVIEKPFEIADLRTTVHRVLKIAHSKNDLQELKKKYGEDSQEVLRHMKIIGLLQAVSASRE